MQRFLRPGFLAPVGDRLWIVDQFWPVAAVLDPVAGEIVRLVSYSELPPPLPSFARWFFGWRALGTSAGLWIQPYPTAPVALINESGLVHANYSSGTRLQVATAAGAWCAAYLPEVSTPSQDAQAGRCREAAEMLLIRPDKSRATVPLHGRPQQFRAGDSGDVYVMVDAGRVGDTEETWVRLPASGSDPEQIAIGTPGSPLPEPLDRWCNGFLGAGTPWHSPPFRDSPGILVGGLRWALGCDQQRIPELWPIATGHEPDSSIEQRRLTLGRGYVIAAAAADRYLVVALLRCPRIDLYHRGPVELIRIDTQTNHVETLVPPASVDITERCWPLPPKPIDADSYAEHQRRALADLDTWVYPLGGDGTYPTEPAVEGMSDLRTELVGNWPDTNVRISFSHPDYPGLRLRKTIPIFDELGRQYPPQDVDVDLMENHATGHWPPASDAIDGVVEI